MSVKPSDLIVEFFDLRELKEEQARRGRLAVGHYYVEDGRPVIGLDIGEAPDPHYLTPVTINMLPGSPVPGLHIPFPAFTRSTWPPGEGKR